MKGSQFWLDGSIVELLFILALIAFRLAVSRRRWAEKKYEKGQPWTVKRWTHKKWRDKMIIIRTLYMAVACDWFACGWDQQIPEQCTVYTHYERKAWSTSTKIKIHLSQSSGQYSWCWPKKAWLIKRQAIVLSWRGLNIIFDSVSKPFSISSHVKSTTNFKNNFVHTNTDTILKI